MKFKTIKAEFEVKARNYHYRFVIERRKSGAFAYGDRSSHLLRVLDWDTREEKGWHLYDTRYDRLSTKKEKWVENWKKFIRSHWQHHPEVRLMSYEEGEEEIN